MNPAAVITDNGARGTDCHDICSRQPAWNLKNIYVGTDGIAYDAAAQACRRDRTLLFFLIGGGYRNAQDDAVCRLQAYQSLLSGACSHGFGTFPLLGFGEQHANGGIGPSQALRSSLSTTASNQMGHLKQLFSRYP